MSMLTLVSVTPAANTYPAATAPSVNLQPASSASGSRFVPDFWLFKMTVASTNDVYVSFDGINDHLHFDKPDATIPVFVGWFSLPSHAQKAWVRRGAGAGGVLEIGAGTNS